MQGSLAWLQWRRARSLDNAEAITTAAKRARQTVDAWLLGPSRTSLHSHIPTLHSGTCTRVGVVFVSVVALPCCHLIPFGPANPCLPRVRKPHHRH